MATRPGRDRRCARHSAHWAPCTEAHRLLTPWPFQALEFPLGVSTRFRELCDAEQHAMLAKLAGDHASAAAAICAHCVAFTSTELMAAARQLSFEDGDERQLSDGDEMLAVIRLEHHLQKACIEVDRLEAWIKELREESYC